MPREWQAEPFNHCAAGVTLSGSFFFRSSRELPLRPHKENKKNRGTGALRPSRHPACRNKHHRPGSSRGEGTGAPPPPRFGKRSAWVGVVVTATTPAGTCKRDSWRAAARDDRGGVRVSATRSHPVARVPASEHENGSRGTPPPLDRHLQKGARAVPAPGGPSPPSRPRWTAR